MAYEIEWAINAFNDYENIVNYLKTKWSFCIAEKFATTLEKKLETLSSQPFIGIASTTQKDIRSILITKHNRLFYRVTHNQIDILNIFDTRQNPQRNIYE
jgi:plasmid stabilization system protein ParE